MRCGGSHRLQLCRYYRKAKAQQILSDTSAAIDTLVDALRKPKLKSDKGLNDALVEAFGGFPDEVTPALFPLYEFGSLTRD